MNRKLIAQLILIFVVTQAIGLYVGNYLIDEGIKTTIVNDNPDSIENSLGLIVWILLFTGILLLLLKFAPKWIFRYLIKGMELMAVFGTSFIVLAVFIPEELFALGLSLILVATRIIFRKNVLLRNVSSVFAAAGAGPLIGASLGIIPILVFIILLSVYDLIAVFKTKHMVMLAKGISKQNLSFTFAMPTKEHQFELGTGDIVIPLAFAVSVLGAAKQGAQMGNIFIVPSLLLFASLIGLIATVHYASLENGKALPALPLQTVLMVIVYGLTMLF